MRLIARMPALALAMVHAASSLAAEFNDGVASAWSFVERDDGVCLLEQPVSDYGVARFTGSPKAALHFEVLGHRELFAAGAVELATVTPPWHPEHPAEHPLGRLEHVSGTGIRVSDPLATRLLMALRSGLDTRLQHEPWYGTYGNGESLVLAVSSVGIRALYPQFVRCAEGSPVPGWADIERTRVGFPTRGALLTDAATAQLDAVAAHAARDTWLTGIFIDGHTDSVGAQQANYRLSQQRAEAVQAYLVAAGVNPALITLRYHGASYPVADNDTAAGRRDNRRATVRLERRWPELAQGSEP